MGEWGGNEKELTFYFGYLSVILRDFWELKFGWTQTSCNEESYNKYMYALKLRTEAAIHIGIENIRKSRLLKLQKEKQAIEAEFKAGKQVYPDFRLSILVRLEE